MTATAHTVALTDFVPVLADELKMPAVLVHLWCQQAASARGIQWGFNLDSKDVETIMEAVMAKHGDAAAKVKETQARARRERAAARRK